MCLLLYGHLHVLTLCPHAGHLGRYLEDLDGALEAPDTVLLQHYAPTARQTVEIGMALQHHADSLSRFLLVVECSPRDGAGAAGGSVCYATPDPPVADVDATGGNRGGGAIPIIVGGVLQGQEDGDIEVSASPFVRVSACAHRRGRVAGVWSYGQRMTVCNVVMRSSPSRSHTHTHSRSHNLSTSIPDPLSVPH